MEATHYFKDIGNTTYSMDTRQERYQHLLAFMDENEDIDEEGELYLMGNADIVEPVEDGEESAEE